MEKVFLKAKCKLVSGGTDSHLILVDTIKSFELSGDEAGKVLENIGIIVNKNTVPFDTRSPMDPSGIRFGTPAITTRGFKEKDCAQVAEIMIEVLRNKDDKKLKEKAKKEIQKLAKKFPIPKKFI